MQQQPSYIFDRLDELSNFGIFEPRVDKHGGNVRVNPPRQVKQNGTILATAERYIDLPAVLHIPFENARLCDLYLPFE